MWRWLENLLLEADPDSSWASWSRGPPYFLPWACFLLWFIYTRACKLNTVRISAWNMSGGGWKTQRKDWVWEQVFPTQNIVNPLFSKRFFWCEPFLKPSLNLLHYCFCFMIWCFGHEARGILAPPPGVEPTLPSLEGDVFTTGSPGQSQSWVFQCKLTSKIPSVCSWAYIQRKIGSEGHKHPSVHCSTVYNSENMEATWMPIDRRMNKEDVVYIYHGMLLRR